MSRSERRSTWVLGFLAACTLLAYLRDPAWLGHVTSGFGRWEQDPAGIRARWMGGRGSFFVSATATRVDIPLRAVFITPPFDPFVIDVRVDDKRVTQVVLREEGWVTATVSIPPVPTSRRFRRVDLRSSRTWDERSISVQVGDVSVR